jgi:hypothetical protein
MSTVSKMRCWCSRNPWAPTLYYGSGAGAVPTASSIVADIVDVVRSMDSEQNNFVPHLAFQPHAIGRYPDPAGG